MDNDMPMSNEKRQLRIMGQSANPMFVLIRNLEVRLNSFLTSLASGGIKRLFHPILP